MFMSDPMSIGARAAFRSINDGAAAIDLNNADHIHLLELEVVESAWQGLRLRDSDSVVWRGSDVAHTQSRCIGIYGSSSDGLFEDLALYDCGPHIGRDQHGVKFTLSAASRGGHVFRRIRIFDCGEDDVQTESDVNADVEIAVFEDFVFGRNFDEEPVSTFENNVDLKTTGQMRFIRGVMDGSLLMTSGGGEPIVDHGQSGGRLGLEAVTIIANGNKRGVRVDGWDLDMESTIIRAPNRAALVIGTNGNIVNIRNCVFEHSGSVNRSDNGVVSARGGTVTIESSTIASEGGMLLLGHTSGTTTLDQSLLWSRDNTVLVDPGVGLGSRVPNQLLSGSSIDDVVLGTGDHPYDLRPSASIANVLNNGIRVRECLGRPLNAQQSYGAYDPPGS